MEEFRAVVFEKDELEYRGMSELIALLPLFANQDSNSDAKNKILHTLKRIVCLK